MSSLSSDQIQTFKLVAVVLGVIGVIIFAVYQNAKIQGLQAKLLQSQLQIDEAKNAQAVKNESDADLLNELNNDVKSGGPPA
jgi:uncharacterized membrane-anchored protein YhcB (DUF1043 family)